MSANASCIKLIVRSLTLVDDQIGAFECLLANQYSILSAPTGFGKTIILVAVAAARLAADPRHKIVVVVPQRIISKGFVAEAMLNLPTGRTTWRVSENLCVSSPRKVSRLRSFLGSPADGKTGRVVVTTHMSFAKAVGGFDRHDLAEAFLHTTLLVDEAHHLRRDDAGTNLLGEAVSRIMALRDAEDSTPSIILATAFLFRGDRLAILTDEELGRFARHHVPFDRHWSRLRHLKAYRYDFVAYAGTPWADVDRLLRQSQEPTIFYCPPNGHRLHLGRDKVTTVGRVIESVLRHYPGSSLWHRSVAADAGSLILDLVEFADRAAKI